MQQKLTIHLYRFMYMVSRGRSKRKKVNVVSGGKMPDDQFLKYSEIAKTLTNGK